MSYNTWPTFVGRGWGIKKRPITRTIIQTADGGQEFRLGRFQTPLYEFDIEIPYLSQTDYATLQAFFAQQSGALTPFQFAYDGDSVSDSVFGTGDGSAKQFTLSGIDGEPVYSAIVDAVYRTDWQGRQLLYPTVRTNHMLYSQSLANAAWDKSNVTVTDGAGVAPDGSTTMSRLTVTATGFSSISQYFGSLLIGPVKLILFAQADTANIIFVQVNQANANNVVIHASDINFNVSTGAIGAEYSPGAFSFNNYSGMTLTPMGSGVYRIELSFNVDPSTTSCTVYTGPSASMTGTSATAGTSLLMWGLAAQTGGGVYIPTTTAPVTVTDYVFTGNTMTMGQVPAEGAQLTWTGQPLYLVRFSSDSIETTETMSEIYEATTITLRSVR